MNEKLKKDCDLLCDEFNNYFDFDNDLIYCRLYTGPTRLKDGYVLNVFFKSKNQKKKSKSIIVSQKKDIEVARRYIKKNIIV